MTERGWIQGFVKVNSSCVRLNSTVGWEGGIYFFNLGERSNIKKQLKSLLYSVKIIKIMYAMSIWANTIV